jgi:hypothetical protein
VHRAALQVDDFQVASPLAVVATQPKSIGTVEKEGAGWPTMLLNRWNWERGVGPERGPVESRDAAALEGDEDARVVGAADGARSPREEPLGSQSEGRLVEAQQVACPRECQDIRADDYARN